jgi:hypothetical protein
VDFSYSEIYNDVFRNFVEKMDQLRIIIILPHLLREVNVFYFFFNIEVIAIFQINVGVQRVQFQIKVLYFAEKYFKDRYEFRRRICVCIEIYKIFVDIKYEFISLDSNNEIIILI